MKSQKGSALVFATISLIVLLALGGIAVDIAALATDRTELHRTTDAAALAGAGNLAFNSSVFPAVRAAAVTYGLNNPTRFGTVALNPNVANDPAGDVVLGTWDGTTSIFTPSLDGTVVNAVLCRTTQGVPTWFLRMIGILGLSMSAESIAVSNPPNTPPACVFPVGVTTCQFFNGSNYTSQGCGTAITFITSSGKLPGTQAGTNTAAWVNLTGGTPSAPYLQQALADAANGTCNSNPVLGDPVNANNGMIQSVMDTFESFFVPIYNSSPTYTIKDTNGNMVYSGHGWEVFVPLLPGPGPNGTGCPPTAVNATYPIQTFAKFVFTQSINHGSCVVNNPADTNSAPLCSIKDPSLRGIFGYFDCAKLDTTPSPIPAPRAALATRLRLVR